MPVILHMNTLTSYAASGGSYVAAGARLTVPSRTCGYNGTVVSGTAKWSLIVRGFNIATHSDRFVFCRSRVVTTFYTITNPKYKIKKGVSAKLCLSVVSSHGKASDCVSVVRRG